MRIKIGGCVKAKKRIIAFVGEQTTRDTENIFVSHYDYVPTVAAIGKKTSRDVALADIVLMMPGIEDETPVAQLQSVEANSGKVKGGY